MFFISSFLLPGGKFIPSVTFWDVRLFKISRVYGCLSYVRGAVNSPFRSENIKTASAAVNKSMETGPNTGMEPARNAKDGYVTNIGILRVTNTGKGGWSRILEDLQGEGVGKVVELKAWYEMGHIDEIYLLDFSTALISYTY